MSTNIVNYVRPIGGQNRKDINKILELITDYTAPAVEDGGAQQRITVTPHRKIRTSDVSFGTSDFELSEIRDKQTRMVRFKRPNSPNAYPLVHSLDGAGALSFPVEETFAGARCDFDGNMSINIAYDPIINPTDKISIACNLYFPAGTLSGIRVLVMKGSTYRLRMNGTSMEWDVWNTTSTIFSLLKKEWENGENKKT